MKELSVEEKARRYDEVFSMAKEWYNNPNSSSIGKSYLYAVLPELKESEDSEDERIRKALVELVHDTTGDSLWVDYDVHKEDAIAWLEKQCKNNMGISEATKQKLEDNLNKALEKETPESWNEFLEEQGEQKPADTEKGTNGNDREIPISEQKPDTDFSDLRTWKYIVDAVLTERDGIGQYIDSPWTADVAEKLQKRFGNINQKPTELPKGDDYGIDSLYAAIDILQKTLGKVEGYQSDDGILTHKCAISAVKELSKQKPWSEEDDRMRKAIIDNIKAICEEGYFVGNIGSDKLIDWLKSLKDRYTWKPSDEHYELEEFAKIVRCNLTGISKAVQELFEAKYLQLTGNKMYGGFKD